MSTPFSRKQTKVSQQEMKRRVEDMYAFLISQPVAANSPMINFDKLVEELSLINGILQKLKAFVRFLSKLNPAEYLRWFHKAYATMTAAPLAETQQTKEQEVPTSVPAILPVTLIEKPTKKAPKRKKSVLPTL